MCGSFTKKKSDEGVGSGVRLGGKEGVPLRVVNGALGLLPQQVGIRMLRNKTYPRRFLDKNNISERGFKEGLKVLMTLSDVRGEDGKVVRH